MGSGGSLPAIATRSSSPPSVVSGAAVGVIVKYEAWMISVHGHSLLRESVI